MNTLKNKIKYNVNEEIRTVTAYLPKSDIIGIILHEFKSFQNFLDDNGYYDLPYFIDKTIRKYVNGNSLSVRAKCHPGDTFIEDVGKEIAYSRMCKCIKKMKEEIAYTIYARTEALLNEAQEMVYKCSEARVISEGRTRYLVENINKVTDSSSTVSEIIDEFYKKRKEMFGMYLDLDLPF